MSSSYDLQELRTTLRTIRNTYLQGLWGTTSVDVSRLDGFMNAMMEGDSSLEAIVVNTTGVVEYGVIEAGKVVYHTTPPVDPTTLMFVNLASYLPDTSVIAPHMNDLMILYHLLASDVYPKMVALRKDPTMITQPTYQFEVVNYARQTLKIATATDWKMVDALWQRTIGNEGSANLFVIRRLVLLYLWMGTYFISKKLEATTAAVVSTQLMDMMQRWNQSDLQEIRDVANLKLQNIQANRETVATLSGDMQTMQKEIGKDVASAKAMRGPMKGLRIFSYILWSLVFLSLVGLVWTIITQDRAVAVGTAAFSLLVALVAYIMLSFIWMTEFFVSSADQPMYDGVLQYLRKTIEFADIIIHHSTYNVLDDLVQKESNTYQTVHDEMVAKAYKADGYQTVVRMNGNVYVAMGMLSVNWLIIFGVTAFILGYMGNTPAARNLIVGIAFVLIMFALLMYFVDTGRRVRTNAHMRYWADANMNTDTHAN